MKRILAATLFSSFIITAVISSVVMADNGWLVRVGIYENEPKIFTDDEGNAAGFWPDLTRYIAQKEGWEIEWVHGTWAECLDRLEKNEIDMMPDVAYSEERDEIFDFSIEPVYVSCSRVYRRANIDINSIFDLEGKTVAVLEGSINYFGPDGLKTLTDEVNINCNFIPVDSYIKVFELMDSKEADAGVVNKDFAYQHQTDFNIVETSIIFQPALFYFAFPTESSLKLILKTMIDNNIREMKENGDSIYYESLKNWMGASPIEKPVVPEWLKWLLIGVGSVILIFVGGTFTLRTQVRKRTMELSESEEKLRLVLETVPHGLVVLDMEGRITQANRAALLMGSYNKNDLIGEYYLDFIVKRDHKKAKENLKNTLEIGFSARTEYTLLRKSGVEFPARIYVGLIKDQSGKPAGFVTVIEDITNIKQAEDAQRKLDEYQQIDKLRTNLLSTVSHELRTPLAGIKGYATLLLEYYSKLKKAQKWESLEAIDRSTDRLTELIEHLLDMSRLDAGLLKLDYEKIDPADIFQAAVTEAKLRSPKHKLKIQIDYPMPKITADARRLRQITDNLLDNAIKYSAEGAEIYLEAIVQPQEIQISVTDQGDGIPTEEINKIFDRFYRLEERLEKDPGGLGLGLSLCKALVEAHGGRIWVESQADQGSTFYFTIPINEVKKS